MQTMKRVRHYRGGLPVAGLTAQARELRTVQTAAEAKLWSMLRNKQLRGSSLDGNTSSETTLLISIVMKHGWSLNATGQCTMKMNSGTTISNAMPT